MTACPRCGSDPPNSDSRCPFCRFGWAEGTPEQFAEISDRRTDAVAGSMTIARNALLFVVGCALVYALALNVMAALGVPVDGPPEQRIGVHR